MRRPLLLSTLLFACLAAFVSCTEAPTDPVDFPRVRLEDAPVSGSRVTAGDTLQWRAVAVPGAAGHNIDRFTVERWDAEKGWTLANQAEDLNGDVFVFQQQLIVPDVQDTLRWRYRAFDRKGLGSAPLEYSLVAGRFRPQVVRFFIATAESDSLPISEVQVNQRIVLQAAARAGDQGADLSEMLVEIDSTETDTTWREYYRLPAAGREALLRLDTTAPATSGAWRWRASVRSGDGSDTRTLRIQVRP